MSQGHKKNILAIIPAREGSKRVHHKNFRPFAGTTLIDLAIQQALHSRLITDIVVSTDNNKVLEISKRYDVMSLHRPEEISGDDSPAIEYVKHALNIVEKQKNIQYDVIVIVQPTSPLRIGSDIDETLNLLITNPEVDSAVSVMRIDQMQHPIKLKRMIGHTLVPYIEDEKGRFLANELPKVYVRNGAVYATWREGIEKRPDVIGEKSLGYIMPAERSVDINEMLDFEFAEFLYNRKG